MLLLIIAGALTIHLEETVKLHNLTSSHKPILSLVYADDHRGLLQLCVSHLRCCSALPYQVIETTLL